MNTHESDSGMKSFPSPNLTRRDFVRTAALAALGDSKDRSLIEWYKDRFAKDDSDLVRAEALRALGKTGDPAVIAFLEQSALVSSHRDMVRTAALQALKQFGRF